MSPCDKCPWVRKNQPDITPDVRRAAESGAWFCCHTRLGTCHGAESYSNQVIIKRNGGVTPQFINDIGGCSANYK
jgi:hypothetical protein